MNEELNADVAASDARLSVRAHAADTGPNGGIRIALRRLLGWPREAPELRSRMRVHVADLQGRDVRFVESCDRFVELPLPPGTYNVTVRLGTIRRRYTMTLTAGAACDLHLRLEGSP